jgi:SOS-response transcriptional repressor LexA
MAAAILSIDELSGPRRGSRRSATWSLLELALPGARPFPFGILVVDRETNQLSLRFRGADDVRETGRWYPEEQELDLLDFLADDLRGKSREMGADRLLASLEDSLSHFLRIGDRNEIALGGSPQRLADRLFDEHVDSAIRRFETHLPLYSLRAAATKFGEGMESSEEGWLRVPERLQPTEDMFVARVVGRSMEPLIPDGSLCVFRFGVKGSRQGKRLLIEKFDETDFAGRYTVKRYTSAKKYSDDGEWEHERIRLEPLNREFEAFDLGPDAFRVVAEFVEVLED